MKIRRSKKIFRSTRCDDARRRWREQFTLQRSTFQKLYAEYRKAINDSEYSKTLWRQLKVLLQPSGAVLSPVSAGEFATFFNGKIAIFGYPLAFLAPDRGVPLGRSPYIWHEGQRMANSTKCRSNIAENFNRLSRAHERCRRQTDRRHTDLR